MSEGYCLSPAPPSAARRAWVPRPGAPAWGRSPTAIGARAVARGPAEPHKQARPPGTPLGLGGGRGVGVGTGERGHTRAGQVWDKLGKVPMPEAGSGDRGQGALLLCSPELIGGSEPRHPAGSRGEPKDLRTQAKAGKSLECPELQHPPLPTTPSRAGGSRTRLPRG